jgi:hypothetical protein
MKVLILSQQERLKSLLLQHLKPVGFEIQSGIGPVELIDRLEELDPDMMIVHAGDFPRHWKPLLRVLRQFKGKDQCIFVLLKGMDFSFEEAAKANFLGVNGILDTGLTDKEMVYRLEELFRRYRSLKDQRKFHRLIPTEQDRLQLVFTNPESMSVVTGRLLEISIQGATFRSVDPAMTVGLLRGMELPFCSLRVGDELTSLIGRITHANPQGEIGLQFKSFATGGHYALFQYIQKRSERDLQKAMKKQGE